MLSQCCRGAAGWAGLHRAVRTAVLRPRGLLTAPRATVPVALPASVHASASWDGGMVVPRYRAGGSRPFARPFSASAASDDAKEQLEKLREANPELYAKYKAKLDAADLSEFESKVSEPDVVDELLAPHLKAAAEKAQAAKVNDPTGKLMGESDSTIKPLGTILKLELVMELEEEAITEIWKEYHKDKEAICAAIPVETYRLLKSRAQAAPFFAFPLPRDDGFEFFLGQWQGNQFAFTSMLEYQMHQDNARPYLLLNHYTELIDAKGIALMAGDLDENVTVIDAQMLANQVQMFYLGSDDMLQLVEDFNKRPDKFDHNDILLALEKMGQFAPAK